MARNGMKSLAAAAMLASAVPTGAQTPDIGTSAQISEVLANDENKEAGSIIFLDDALIKSQIEEQLNKAIKDRRLEELVNFYGEDEVKSRINEIIDEIVKNPNEYGRFDSNGNFDLFDGDGSLIFEKQWKSLYESKYAEYCKYKGERDANVAAFGVAFAWLILSIFESIKYGKLEEENKQLKNKLKNMN